MRDSKILSYDDIETTPANELMELSFEQLDRFLAEAKQRQREAEAVADWLKAIKSIKASRSFAARTQKGGQHD